MNTVNSFQYYSSFQHHRLSRRGTLGYNDDEDRDLHITTACYLKQFGRRNRHDGWPRLVQLFEVSAKETIAEQSWQQRKPSVRRRRQTTASLRPSWQDVPPLSVGDPVSSRDTTFVPETTGHTKRPKSPLV